MARFWVAEGHEDGALYIKVIKAPGSKGGEKAPATHFLTVVNQTEQAKIPIARAGGGGTA